MRLNGNLSVVGLLKDVKIDRLAADPVAPATSQLWFNTTDKVMRYFDGTTVQTIAQGGNLDGYLKLDGTVPMEGELVLSSTDQSESADNVAVSKGYLTTVAATKQDVVTGAASTVVSADLALSKVVVTDASGKISASVNATAAEVEHLFGVTSSIQDQIDSKQSDLGYEPVDRAGDSMTGNLAMNGNIVSGLGAPVNAQDAVRKVDLETAMTGLDFQEDVLGFEADFSAETPVAGRYIYGDASIFGNNGNHDVAAGDIVEVDADGEVTAVVYDVSVAGEGALAWNRAIGSFVFYNGTVWSEFGGLAGVTAGIGLAKEGNTLYVNMGAGIVQLPSDEVGIDLFADGGLMLTTDGSDDSTDGEAQLAVRADDSTIERSAAGIRVKASGVTEAHLNGSVAGNGLLGGDGVALAVQTVAESGIVVDAEGVSVDRAELRTTFLGRDGAEAMTGVLLLSSSDQSAAVAEAAVSKGHLDAALTAQGESLGNLEERVGAGYFVYDGTAAPATSHTVTHNMGNKYVQVSIVDASDEVVLPESITFTDANSLTVTFSAAEACRVIVTGLKAAA